MERTEADGRGRGWGNDPPRTQRARQKHGAEARDGVCFWWLFVLTFCSEIALGSAGNQAIRCDGMGIESVVCMLVRGGLTRCALRGLLEIGLVQGALQLLDLLLLLLDHCPELSILTMEPSDLGIPVVR